ncbi:MULTISPECIES: hypothetical protein [unclassified Mammaliicoccus]|uniref:hypothetical protein n=1 Tax=unclassified Mammaliicoccus TaxID=2803851 RepID=UPI001EFA65FA|nr:MULTISPECIES: hypothetical protein [unclassified Mammaliicoccus]
MIKEYPRIPRNALYCREDDALQTFSEIDSPNAVHAISFEDQQIIMNWVKELEPMKTMNRNHTSYSLKSIFEKSENGFYISNGVMKEILYLMGFVSGNQQDLNWNFNVSEKSVQALKAKNKL